MKESTLLLFAQFSCHFSMHTVLVHGDSVSFISCCLIFRARPLNPFEKERGDKNIIKLPGDGAVWVSYMYCFIECFHDREGNL